jgi:glutamine amidotransferase
VFPGTVKRFQLTDLKVPHMGWNQITVSEDHADIFKYIDSGDHTYFVHSYYVPDTDAACVATTTHYGGEFVSSVRKGNCFGTQFHPEKSGDVGLNILKGFLESVS